MKGFFNRLLKINVTQESFKEERVPDRVYEQALGGKGLGTYLLLKENPPNIDPFSPENRIIFTVGCATDTRVWGSTRYGVFTKSPLTGIFSESYSGGKIATPMSRTGYDAIVIEGASSEPVFLEISEGKVRFHPAQGLWGKGTYETEAEVLRRTGVEGAGVLVIGPAGERLVKFALIENDRWRSAGRTGVGAVLGSKKLKAIVFHGKTQRQVANPEILKSLFDELSSKGKTNAGVQNYKMFGTPMMVALTNTAQAFPSRYWSQGTFGGWEKVSAETLLKQCRVTPRACTRCFMACGKLSEVVEGRHKGLIIEGPEYETIYAFGGLCLIDSIEEIIYLNELCDHLGIDTMTAGNLAAFTIEASLKGVIPDKLAYGDVDGIAELLQKIAYRRGAGDILAEGIRQAANEWGMEEVAVHVKGLEPAGYDPRILKGMALAYATSARGACHLRSTFYAPELKGIIHPDQIEGKAELFVDYEERLALYDALILCRFYRDIVGWEEISRIIQGATGMTLDKKGLKDMASRIIDSTRRFNLQEGVTSKDDTLPQRFFEEGLGPEKKVIKRADLHRMVKEYYRLRGWDENGVPPPP